MGACTITAPTPCNAAPPSWARRRGGRRPVAQYLTHSRTMRPRCRCGTHSAFSKSEQTCVHDSSAPKLGDEAAFVMRINSDGKIVSGTSAVTVCTDACPRTVEWLCVDGSSFESLQKAKQAYGSLKKVAANCGHAYPSSKGPWARRQWGQARRPQTSHSPPAAGPYCLPDDDNTGQGAKDYNAAVGKSRRGHAVSSLVRALKDAGWVYVVAAVTAIGMGYAYIKLVQHCALPMAVVGMGTILVGFCAGGAMVYTSSACAGAGPQPRPPPAHRPPSLPPLRSRSQRLGGAGAAEAHRGSGALRLRSHPTPAVRLPVEADRARGGDGEARLPVPAGAAHLGPPLFALGTRSLP